MDALCVIETLKASEHSFYLRYHTFCRVHPFYLGPNNLLSYHSHNLYPPSFLPFSRPQQRIDPPTGHKPYPP
jgi:hypothetical protein